VSHVNSSDDRVAAVRVLARLHRMLEATDSGLTLPQYRVLAAVAQGGVRSAHLAERLAVRRPTLTAIADGLVAAGYACRQSEAGDRRVVRLFATDAGRSILAAADAAYAARIGRLLDEIPNPDAFVADLVSVGHALDARLRADLRDVATTEPEPAPKLEVATQETEAAL
jgi:DNA-binding MarR family transcriptional regulator